MPLKSVSELPNEPAVYAMYGGRGRDKDVAYVGIARKLKQRIQRHLVPRDSSVTTGVSAVSLNPEHVTKVSWWEHQSFSDDVSLNAAELIAFEEINPDLLSRGNITTAASELSAKPSFPNLLQRLVGSPSLKSIADEIEGSDKDRIHKQNWKPQAELQAPR